MIDTIIFATSVVLMIIICIFHLRQLWKYRKLWCSEPENVTPKIDHFYTATTEEACVILDHLIATLRAKNVTFSYGIARMAINQIRFNDKQITKTPENVSWVSTANAADDSQNEEHY